MDAIDSLGAFAKAQVQGHKYVSRKRGPSGWIYTYDPAQGHPVHRFWVHDRRKGSSQGFTSRAAAMAHVAQHKHPRDLGLDEYHPTKKAEGSSKPDVKKLLEGNFGVPRIEMPQIPSKSVSSWIDSLEEKGIGVARGSAPVSDLKATQGELHADRVQEIIDDPEQRKNLSKPVIVSNDGYLLDGHHRWAALTTIDPSAKIDTVKVDLPIGKLLAEAHGFPGVEYKKADAIDLLEDLAKGEARGGKYYRRIPKPGGKGWRYFYTKQEYDAHHGVTAHVAGKETLTDRQKSGPKRKWISAKEATEKFGLPEETRTAHKKDGEYTPERKALHEQIISHFSDHVVAPKGAQKVAILTMGGPASGKSSLLRTILGPDFRSDLVNVNADDVKEKLPEYQRAINLGKTKDGRPMSARNAAWMAHEESSDVADEVERRAVAAGKSLVIDGTGKNPDKYVKKIAELKAKGYHVRLLMPHIQMGEAIRRVQQRAQDEGRYVPDEVTIDAHRKIPGNFERIAREADDFALFHSGTPPKVIWTGGKGQEDKIHDPKLHEEFNHIAHAIAGDVGAEKRISGDIYAAKKSGDFIDMLKAIQGVEAPKTLHIPFDEMIDRILAGWDPHNREGKRHAPSHANWDEGQHPDDGIVQVVQDYEDEAKAALSRLDAADTLAEKSMDAIDDLERLMKNSPAEGSRGGRVIGHTSSGKPIYASSHKHSSFKTFSKQDHEEAAKLHHGEQMRLNKEAIDDMAPGFRDRNKARDKQGAAHQSAQMRHSQAARESIEKGGERAGHKYLSRKRNASGGYDYVYAHPKTGERAQVSTSLTMHESGSRTVHSREPGGPRHHGGTAIDRKGGATKIENHPDMDEHSAALHHAALKDTLRRKKTVQKLSHKPYDRATEHGAPWGSGPLDRDDSPKIVQAAKDASKTARATGGEADHRAAAEAHEYAARVRLHPDDQHYHNNMAGMHRMQADWLRENREAGPKGLAERRYFGEQSEGAKAGRAALTKLKALDNSQPPGNTRISADEVHEAHEHAKQTGDSDAMEDARMIAQWKLRAHEMAESSPTAPHRFDPESAKGWLDDQHDRRLTLAQEKKMRAIVDQSQKKSEEAGGMDPIDRLGVLAKAVAGGQAAHKYVSRKRNAHGGWDYVYKHPTTGQEHQVTVIGHGGSMYTNHGRAYPSGNVHMHKIEGSDEHVHAMHEHALKDAIAGGPEPEKEPEKSSPKVNTESLLAGNLGIKRIDMPQIRSFKLPDFLAGLNAKGVKTEQGEVAVGSLKATQSEIHPEKVQEMIDNPETRKNLAKQVIVSNDGFVLDGHHRWAALTTIDPKSKIKTMKVDLPMRSLLEEAAGFEGVEHAKSTINERLEARVMSDEMTKGLYNFSGRIGDGPGTIPDEFLYDYLCAFVEEAYEHERAEREHQNVLVPPASTGEKIEDVHARAILHELVSMMGSNSNLKRAATKFSVTKDVIASILRDKGIVRPYSDAGTWTDDYDSLRSMGGQGVTRPLMLSETKRYRDVTPDIFGAPVGVPLAKAEPEASDGPLYVDDTTDPHDALAKSEVARLAAAGHRQTSEWKPNISTTCMVHGSADLTKSMNLANPHARCTCPR